MIKFFYSKKVSPMEIPIHSKIQAINKSCFFSHDGILQIKAFWIGVKYLMRFFTADYKHHPGQVKNGL